MIVNEYKCKGYNLHTIKTNKFKMCHVEVIFRDNLNVLDLSKRNVLFDMLCDSTLKYPSNRLLNIKLQDLYNASIYSSTSKIGSSVITNLCLDFLCPEYSEKEIVKDAFKLLFEVIFNPLVNNQEFNKNVLDRVKNNLKADISSIVDNPSKLAIRNSLELLNNEYTSYYPLGTIKDVDMINENNLYDYYEQVINTNLIDIYVVGNLDMEYVASLISKLNKFNIIKNHDVNYYVKEEKRKLINKYDSSDYSQTNLVFLLNLNGLNDYEKKYVANLYNIILGGGSLQSKLSQRLRCENSLCYFASSIYLKYDNLILINTGIDKCNEEKAIKIIRNVLIEMTNSISEEEIKNAKELVISSLNMNFDDPGKIVDNRFYYDLGLIDDFDIRLNTFKDITIEDIYKLSKKINICEIYSLRGDCNGEE